MNPHIQAWWTAWSRMLTPKWIQCSKRKTIFYPPQTPKTNLSQKIEKPQNSTGIIRSIMTLGLVYSRLSRLMQETKSKSELFFGFSQKYMITLKIYKIHDFHKMILIFLFAFLFIWTYPKVPYKFPQKLPNYNIQPPSLPKILEKQ